MVRSVGPPSGSPIACSPSHVPDDRRTQVRAHEGPAVGAERDIVDRARVGRERRAVRRAGLRVPHEDRPFERSRGQEPSVRTEVQRAGRLARRPRAAGGSRRPVRDVDEGHRAGVVARDQRPAAVGEDRRLHVRAPDRERLSDPAPRRDLPDPDGPGSARDGDPLRVRAEGDPLRAARPRRFGGDRPADHPTGRGVPQRDVVRLLRARGDDAAVGAVPNDGERGLSGCRRRRVGQLPQLLPCRIRPTARRGPLRPRSPASARRG